MFQTTNQVQLDTIRLVQDTLATIEVFPPHPAWENVLSSSLQNRVRCVRWPVHSHELSMMLDFVARRFSEIFGFGIEASHLQCIVFGWDALCLMGLCYLY